MAGDEADPSRCGKEETDRQTDRQTEVEREREREREKQIQTLREKETERN